MANIKIVWQRIGAVAGVIAPFLAFMSIFLAILKYNQFSWANNALSDLGVIQGITQVIFNFGLIFSGLLAFSFAIFGLYNYLAESLIGKIGALLFAASALALVAIGVFTENYSPTHYFVSVAFFSFAPLSLLVISSAFWLTNKHRKSEITIVVGVLATLPWIFYFVFNYVPNVAIPEAVSGLIISIWVIGIAREMLRRKR